MERQSITTGNSPDSPIMQNLPTCLDVNWGRALDIHERALRDPPVVISPRVYQLETTSRCNLACSFCPRRTMTRGRTIMSDDLFDHILNTCLDATQALELFGFGEPFTDPSIGNRIAALQDAGIYVVIATNGLLLQGFSDAVIARPDYLVYDVDSVSEGVYSRLRRGGSFSLMRENLDRVLDVRSNYTVLQFIQVPENEHETDLFLELYAGRADELRIKFFDTFAGQVGCGSPQVGVKCLEPFYGVSIWSNGDVVMCDRDYDSKHKLGNVTQHSLADIWDGAKSKAIRESHRAGRGESVALCSQCTEWELTNLRNVPELTVNMFRGDFI